MVAAAVETGPFDHLTALLVGASLPSTDAEEWRYSRVDRLDTSRYRLAAELRDDESLPAVPDEVTAIIESLGATSGVVVLVDGALVLCELDAEAAGAGATFAAVPSTDRAVDATDHDVFASLNRAVAESPIELVVPRAVRLDAPFVVVSVVTSAGSVVAPRVTVRLADGAAATLVEVHRSGPVDALVVPVTDVTVGRDATLRHAVVQDLADSATTVGSLVVTVEDNGTFDGWVAALGADWARLRMDCRLVGRGATGNLAALYTGTGDQMRDLRTFQDHIGRDTSSQLTFKGAVDDRSHAVYTGLIRIHPEGRGSNAVQSNRILTLSDEAWAESVPNLEIEQNDVRCAHASTVGPVDADQRFYLESRGVPSDVAERLIVSGFFDEILDRCPVAAVAALARPGIAEALGDAGASGS